MATSLPLMFGEALLGGFLLSRGVKAIRGSFASGGEATSETTTSPGRGAGGVSAGGASSSVNPFALAGAFKLGRTDQGVDASMAPGSPILAPFPSRLVRVDPNWYRGQPGLFFQITEGPYKGRYWYLAEQIDPSVHVGQLVGAGQQVATYAHTGTGVEIGWAANAAQTLAQTTGGYVEGQATRAGQSFLALLRALGVN